MPHHNNQDAGQDMIPFHARLGDIGLQVFRCNHSLLVMDEERLDKAIFLKKALSKWYVQGYPYQHGVRGLKQLVRT
jgi:hypothetical protein